MILVISFWFSLCIRSIKTKAKKHHSVCVVYQKRQRWTKLVSLCQLDNRQCWALHPVNYKHDHTIRENINNRHSKAKNAPIYSTVGYFSVNLFIISLTNGPQVCVKVDEVGAWFPELGQKMWYFSLFLLPSHYLHWDKRKLDKLSPWGWDKERATEGGREKQSRRMKRQESGGTKKKEADETVPIILLSCSGCVCVCLSMCV